MAANGSPAGKKLTPRQRRAIAALLSEKDVLAAAKKARVGERTLRRWLDSDEVFQAQLKAAEAAAIDSAIRRLSNLTGQAVSTLRDVMSGKDCSAGARVRAADVALARLLDLRELAQLEARLGAIERALQIGGKS